MSLNGIETDSFGITVVSFWRWPVPAIRIIRPVKIDLKMKTNIKAMTSSRVRAVGWKLRWTCSSLRERIRSRDGMVSFVSVLGINLTCVDFVVVFCVGKLSGPRFFPLRRRFLRGLPTSNGMYLR